MITFTRKFTIYLFISIIFFGTIAILYYINITKLQYLELSKKTLKQEAIAHYKNMVDTRNWNSSFGGVFFKAKEGDKPNKYLRDNHTFSKENELLIKINPAWMTRQISEISNRNGNYYYKITSLNPINPENIVDSFDKEALLFLKNNKKEKYYTKFEKNTYNFMGALEVKKSCLECHSEQGYKVGDVRGGLRVSIPTKNFDEKVDLIESNSLFLSLIVVVISIILAILGLSFINNIYKRQREIERLNLVLENKVKKRTQELEANVKKLNELATIDYLTQIPNRRYFFELGEKLLNLAKRDKTELSLIILDIDFFKNINDTYGHQIGDNILQKVSLILKNNIRTSDVLARFGGEEFVILLNETSTEGSFVIAEKLREKVEAYTYVHNTSKINVTISLGISSFDGNTDKDIDDILHRADEALYISKDSGRNKVTKN